MAYVIITWSSCTEHRYLSFKETGLLERLEVSNKYVLPYELERQYYEEMQAAIKEVEKERKRKIKESLQKGLRKGRQEGIQARNLEIAKQMLQEGEPMEKIQKWTGLSEAEINALK